MLLANCSLSLHHVGLPEHGAKHGRTEVLRTIHQAGFSRIVLIEPDTSSATTVCIPDLPLDAMS